MTELRALSEDRDAIGEVLAALAAFTIRRLDRELSLTAVSTLGTVERTGPRRLTDLAVTEGITQPSMTVVVSQLEDHGFAERRSDPTDGRVVLVFITRSGREYLRSLRRINAAALTALIDKLPATELDTLYGAMPALRHLRDFAAESPAKGGDRRTDDPLTRR
jgi:DNA-binding MarR family transcriptional regulator